MRVLFDLVINHCSDQHKWFKESRSSVDNPKRKWFIWRKPKGWTDDGKPIPPNNWKAAFGGSVWEWDELTQEYYLHLFAVEQPDFVSLNCAGSCLPRSSQSSLYLPHQNWEEEEVRKALYDEAANFWLERGVDGFR